MLLVAPSCLDCPALNVTSGRFVQVPLRSLFPWKIDHAMTSELSKSASFSPQHHDPISRYFDVCHAQPVLLPPHAEQTKSSYSSSGSSARPALATSHVRPTRLFRDDKKPRWCHTAHGLAQRSVDRPCGAPRLAASYWLPPGPYRE